MTFTKVWLGALLGSASATDIKARLAGAWGWEGLTRLRLWIQQKNDQVAQ